MQIKVNYFRTPTCQLIELRSLCSHSLPTNSAKQMFKPFKKAESLLALILRNLVRLGLNTFWCDV